MSQALLTPKSQQKFGFCAEHTMSRAPPVPKTVESRPIDLKDTGAREADEKNLNVNNEVNEGQPKVQVPGPWINPWARSDNTKHGKRRHIKPKQPTIVRAEDIRIEAMDPDDPRSHLPVPPQNIQNIPRDPQHGLMSWTACYDDSCPVHFSDKNGSGWFPKAPRRRRR
ncbi:uncharacterized protein H6S33_005832 [Morchella sextelata]|uniref:uncharacterized protein n=1 Tax=Morchella sextelata TaxID=1174677 RepID=UPI001D054D7E|nr:uncharacterized protein H6S33_005832 [Morchella sextelata]KAH0613946.1 hypothetical protein H6S33_005832 [Morchella sextelata]